MKSIQKTVYVAEDGSEFTSKQECQKHEQFLIEQEKRLANLNVYTVAHSFETTEGRGYYGRLYIITDQDYSVILQYCFERFGKPIRPWYGKSFYSAWRLYEANISPKKALQQIGQKVSMSLASSAKTEAVFISGSNIDYPNMPEAIFPEY